jgi:hypothetical protein
MSCREMHDMVERGKNPTDFFFWDSSEEVEICEDVMG